MCAFTETPLLVKIHRHPLKGNVYLSGTLFFIPVGAPPRTFASGSNFSSDVRGRVLNFNFFNTLGDSRCTK
jgi:hypothetical protein